MKITVLCKVVDNFGDVGVMFRLVKQMQLVATKPLEINIVIDDLISFNKIYNKINPQKDFQQIDGLNIYNWKSEEFCHSEFIKNDGEKMSVILECFQCGRPDWMEKILFDEKLNRTVQVIMIDYLTAEKYAEDFHCLESLTRSKKVQKINFMPGFTEKTGGLIIDKEWEKLPDYNQRGKNLVFTYERDWTGLVGALKSFGREVCVAQGRGLKSFETAWGNDNGLIELPYLNQNEWDKMMKECSVLFIRGEESMSRACLSGIPFVWHAYPQSDEYQLVKVNALLERMSRHFKNEDFEIIKEVWLCFNSPEKKVGVAAMMTACSKFLNKADSLVYGFRDFALDLRKNGDLAANLMTLIEKKYIIDE